MKLRIEQTFRDGGMVVIGSTLLLPLWLLGAAVHRTHWGTITAEHGWVDFVLSWSAFLWGGGMALLLAFWSAFATIEESNIWGAMWVRTLCGCIILLCASFLSVPGWLWAGELVGATSDSVLIAALKSLLVPFFVMVVANLQSVFLPTYAVVIGSTLCTTVMSEWMWTDLLG